MRLDKFLAHHLDISRTIVNKELRAKVVEVDGQIVTKGGHQLSENVCVFYRGSKILAVTEKRYFMLHKPAGYICATRDDEHPTVLHFLDEPMMHKLHSAGRLDKETTGLVLITDDGQWSHRVTSPKHHFLKEYHVTLAEPVDPYTIEKFAEGILLKGEKTKTKPATLHIHDQHHATVLLSEGRYHQVRRMFVAVGNHVTALHRHRIGDLILDIPEGKYRPLTDKEIELF